MHEPTAARKFRAFFPNLLNGEARKDAGVEQTFTHFQYRSSDFSGKISLNFEINSFLTPFFTL